MYVGPVVAAQVLDPSPQTSYPRKEKTGVGGGGVYAYLLTMLGKVFYPCQYVFV